MKKCPAQTFTTTQVTAFDTEVNSKALVYRDNKSDRHRKKEEGASERASELGFSGRRTHVTTAHVGQWAEERDSYTCHSTRLGTDTHRPLHSLRVCVCVGVCVCVLACLSWSLVADRSKRVSINRSGYLFTEKTETLTNNEEG